MWYIVIIVGFFIIVNSSSPSYIYKDVYDEAYFLINDEL